MANYLFVCIQNKVRSKAAAEHFSELLNKKSIEGHVESAGFVDSCEHPVNREMCEKADVIFVMEEWMIDRLFQKYQADKNKIVNLDILDIYYGGKVYEEWALGGKTEEEKRQILERPEVYHKWGLGRVLDEKRLEQYIK